MLDPISPSLTFNIQMTVSLRTEQCLELAKQILKETIELYHPVIGVTSHPVPSTKHHLHTYQIDMTWTIEDSSYNESLCPVNILHAILRASIDHPEVFVSEISQTTTIVNACI